MTSKIMPRMLYIRTSYKTTINPINGPSGRVAVDEFIPPLPSQQMPRTTHEDETVKQAKDFLMRTHYRSLAKAAEITKLTENELLDFGKAGKINFVTPLPVGLYLNPVNEEKRLWGIPDPEGFPALLVLNGTDCQEIQSQVRYEQGSFDKIISPFSGEIMLPLNGESKHGGKWAWRTFTHSYKWFPRNIEITRECIFVLYLELLQKFPQIEIGVKREAIPLTTLTQSEKVDGESSKLCKPAATLDAVAKSKIPPAFTKALNKLLEEISQQSIANGIEFDKNKMPGTKKDLLEVASKFDSVMDVAERTFDDYLAGSCKFRKGRQPSGTSNPYIKLFPKYFPTTE